MNKTPLPPSEDSSSAALHQLLSQGLDGLPEAITLLLNAAMRIERQRHLHAEPYERCEERTGRANGFQPKTLQTRFGKLQLHIPQVRDSPEPFYPSALDRGQRSEVALKLTVAEAYLQGVSTRKVTQIMGQLCGFEVTSTQVSRVTAELDQMLAAWRERTIEEPIGHLILDATYEKVRVSGQVRNCSLLIALGVRQSDGRRQILGCSVSLSEAEIHWRNFLQSLRQRGLGLPRTITSDAHEGLKAACAQTLPGVPWQRCQFHLQQNAQAYIPRVEMKPQVAADIRRLFQAESLPEAQEQLRITVDKYRKTAPRLATWMEENLPEGFTIMSLPEPIRKRLRTSNACENLNKQVKRRTRVCGLFPNEASLLRLATAILMEQSEEWETGKAYLPPEHLQS